MHVIANFEFYHEQCVLGGRERDAEGGVLENNTRNSAHYCTQNLCPKVNLKRKVGFLQLGVRAGSVRA